jgi:hypothetical protein
LSVCWQCKLLGIARSSLYYWKEHHEEQEKIRQELFAGEKAFAEIVMDAWADYPTYGYLNILGTGKNFHIFHKNR